MKIESKAVEFIFQDTEIHFLLGNEKNVMVNATEMAKVFGKRVGVFMKTENVKEFIFELERTPNGVRSDCKITDNRGHMGMYFDRRLALKFAAWLDVKFEIWVYSKIEEILFGKAKVAGERICEVALKEAKIKKLQDEVWKSDNELAKTILREQNELKQLKNMKVKAVNVFVKSCQPTLFDENLN
jgi:pyruvate-formate lyase